MPMKKQDVERAEDYDREAEEIDWRGPGIVFGLASPYIRPEQSIIDIGIGTGLGSEPFHEAGLHVTGMDISEEMLEACRQKGFCDRLVRHDLTVAPYPFGDASFDHAVSTGVFQFFEELRPVFEEVRRILKDGGVFVFVTGDRVQGGSHTVVAGPEHTGTGSPVTMYCHSVREVKDWLEGNGFSLIDTVRFTVWMDSGHSEEFPMRAYLARKNAGQH
jgi:predicted TPR repeat methyltransferase